MIGKKINQLATELAPVSTDLTIIGDPTTGVSKKITLAQLGAIFSGAVSFYNDFASFPATGDINVIYCAKDTKKLYLWSGSAYVEVFPSQALLDTYQLRSEKGVSNGYASLDSNGKVPIGQLPSSIMEYKGTWNAATNTPTLANGTGDTGDVYICNVAGTVNFGAGPLTFAVGDYVVYSGTIWQRSSGAVGTVTSVAASITGDAIGITGSPVTTSGTLALAFGGTSAQYINGAGNLINFPTSLVTGTGTLYALTKWGFTSGNIINSNLSDSGSVIYNTNPTAGSFAVQFNGNTTTGLSYGLLINAGSDANDIAFRIQNVSSTSEYFFVYGDGKVKMNNIPNATTDTDKFLVSDGGFIKYRTGAELLSDIGGASASGYVPYTGATTNLDLGTFDLTADVITGATGVFSSSGSGNTFAITHSSGSGIALNITKGGNGEGLYINKTSGSGNAATIVGTLEATTLVKTGGTSSQFLKADGSVDSSSYITLASLSASSPLSYNSGTGAFSISQASGSTNGYLSSTDWTTFNNKQNALTNPVTGTGTTNYLPKFTGTSTIGNSIVQDDGSSVTIGGTLQSFNASPIFLFSTASTSNYEVLAIDKSATDARIRVYKSGTGSYRNLIFETGGSTRLTLDASGNLGLGNSPDNGYTGYKLQIGSSSDSQTFLSIGNSTTGLGPLNGLVIGNDSTGADIYQRENAPLRFHTNNTEVMRLNASGNLSVGNTNDTYKLDVSGTGMFRTTSSTPAIRVLLSGNANSTVLSSVDNSGYGWELQQEEVSTGDFRIFRTVANVSTQVLNLARATGAATFSSTLTTGGITGIAVSPSPNTLSNGSIDLLNGAGMFGYSNRNYITANMYYSSSWTYKANAAASLLNLIDGGMILYGAASGTAGNAVSLSTLLSIAQTGAATFSSSVTAASTLYLGNDGTYGSTYRTLGLTGTTNGTHRIFAGTSDDLYIAAASGRNIAFWTDGSSDTRMFINTIGNVGIGTTSPSQKLHVASSGVSRILIENTANAGTGAGIQMLVMSGATQVGNGTIRTDNSDHMQFFNLGGERMRITSGGNVEINTGSIKTGEPDTGYGRAAVKIGARNTGEATSSAGHIPVNIDGTVYFINLYSSLP